MCDLEILVGVASTSSELNEVLRLHLDSHCFSALFERRRGLSYKNTIDFGFEAEPYSAESCDVNTKMQSNQQYGSL